MTGNEKSNIRREEEEKKLQKKYENSVSKKIQHFIWKVCHDRIPVGVNLKKRRVKIDDMRIQCGEEDESIEHISFLSLWQIKLI